MNTIEQASGRWRDILGILGVQSRFLSNKHGPCPICGGKDRYRWDDKDGSGSYYCNQCGPGNGVMLLRKLNGWDFATACNKIDEVIGRTKHQPTAPKIDHSEKRRADIERTLAEATHPDIVRDYLLSRGLKVIPDSLLGHRALFHIGDDDRTGVFPAVIAPILGPDGRPQSCQRIYLADVTPKKKLMPAVETVSGGAARLFQHGDDLGLSEGVETGIAAHELFSVPVWAAITATGIELFVPPAGVKRLIVFADNDSNFQGQKSAYALAHKLSVAKDRTIEIIEVRVPPKVDTDWLDVLAKDRT